MAEFKFDFYVKEYVKKWQIIETDQYSYRSENFQLILLIDERIDLLPTLHNIDGETLLKMAVDLGVETPDFIPSMAHFKNEIKSSYSTAYSTFEKAWKQIETHPDIAIGLANSALESIIKEILKDDKIKTKSKPGQTLYSLTSDILKEFQLYPTSEMPSEIKTIGSSLLAISQNIEKIRSEKTFAHGKIKGDYVIVDTLYTYLIVNAISTVGTFLISFYQNKFKEHYLSVSGVDDLPF